MSPCHSMGIIGDLGLPGGSPSPPARSRSCSPSGLELYVGAKLAIARLTDFITQSTWIRSRGLLGLPLIVAPASHSSPCLGCALARRRVFLTESRPVPAAISS